MEMSQKSNWKTNFFFYFSCLSSFFFFFFLAAVIITQNKKKSFNNILYTPNRERLKTNKNPKKIKNQKKKCYNKRPSESWMNFIIKLRSKKKSCYLFLFFSFVFFSHFSIFNLFLHFSSLNIVIVLFHFAPALPFQFHSAFTFQLHEIVIHCLLKLETSKTFRK